eukprot:m.59451 g.59451  ORF g.59451 m.59451 type:complete len:188 (+) comp7910_c0_seq1:35-598(+)
MSVNDMLIPSFVALPYSSQPVRTLKYSKDAIYERLVSDEELVNMAQRVVNEVVEEAVDEVILGEVVSVVGERKALEVVVRELGEEMVRKTVLDVMPEVMKDAEMEVIATNVLNEAVAEILDINCQEAKYGCINNNGVKIIVVKPISKFRKKPRHPSASSANASLLTIAESHNNSLHTTSSSRTFNEQ